MLINFEEVVWNTKRDFLQNQLIKAALNLSEHTGANSYLILIPNTTPQLYIKLTDNP